MVEYTQLDQIPRAPFEALLRESWQQNWPDALASEIVQWRFYDRPAGAVTWVAMDGDRCVGMLDSMLRPYRLQGRRVTVRETADWYCVPAWRPRGIGLRLIRQAMQPHGLPVFVLGGSSHTISILPRLHWKVLPPATGYVLPLSARGLAANLIRQRAWARERLARLIPPYLPARPARYVVPPQEGNYRVLDRNDRLPPLPVPRDNGLVQLFEADHWAWMQAMPPDLAAPLGIAFYQSGRLVGFSLSQLEPTASGLDAKLVHMQSNDSLLAWVVSVTARVLRRRGVGFVRCCVSTPAKMAAIEAVGFMKSRDVPCHWWPGETEVTPTRLDVGYLRGDDAMPFQALRGRQLASGGRRA